MPFTDWDILEGIGEAIGDFGAWLGLKGLLIVLVVFVIIALFIIYN